ncbi:hypothetical protein, partial [Waltera sp.]|uniref:hypothetical protein n=1 Tax=Waltera sp. TaxID=2815806 RepID=UPI003AB1AAED
ITMIITEIQYFFSKIIRFQAIFKDTVEFTCALEFKISSQQKMPTLYYVLCFRKELNARRHIYPRREKCAVLAFLLLFRVIKY